MGLRGPDQLHIPDYSSATGAASLARKIELFWAKHGFPCVRAEVVRSGRFAKDANATSFSVRTNLICGLPPVPHVNGEAGAIKVSAKR